ncbi:MAG: alpha/beta hydrolase [Clostridia bacterium]|nr:alpha/beta hydrolase [Clostridia bacterium]
MIYKRITFSDTAYLDCYIHETYQWDIVGKVNKCHPAILICPGGGFNDISCSEAEPVALTFLGQGFSCFVLTYTTGDACSWKTATTEMMWAIKTVRDNAKEWNINPDALAVMGFSAGGTMGAIAATQWKNTEEGEYLRPNACVLAYGDYDLAPIVREDTPTPEELGMPKTEGKPEYYIVNAIDKDTPPCFIWHTRRDSAVPTWHSIDFAYRLDDFDIDYEFHLWDFCDHGMTVFNRNTDSDNYDSRIHRNVGKWVEMCSLWLMNRFGY